VESELFGHERGAFTGARTLEACERRHIRRVLDEVNWLIGGKQGAAEILGVPLSTLRSRMTKPGTERPEGA